jgi:hypothetical protein
MSLVGNLEDLGLGDILQIVSLSRKSGVLSLRGRGREGKIIFLDGQVVHATSSVFRENLGDLLLRNNIVDLDTLKNALALQRHRKDPIRLGSILIDSFGISQTSIENAIKEQVEKIVYSFFGWTEGAFAFDLGEPEELATTNLDPLQFMLEQGLNPQWLAMEGSRILDEKRHRGESLEEKFEDPRMKAKAFAGGDEPADYVSPTGPGAGIPPAPSLYNFGAELLREIGEGDQEEGLKKGPETPGLHLLKGMLQELNNPSTGGGIILLVLRFASELMNRAVIFLVKEKEIVGLGQFGIDTSGEMVDVRVRGMKVPRCEESMFQGVLDERIPLKVRPGNGFWDAYIREKLGGGDAAEVFLGPIIREGKVVAVIYGDHLPENKPIGDTESLEIFLSQAGLAMEKALLERRLKASSLVPNRKFREEREIVFPFSSGL